jgi:hypothetical protein
VDVGFCEGLMGEVSSEVNSLLLRVDFSVILRQAVVVFYCYMDK